MKQPPAIVVQLIHIEGPFKGEIQEFSQSEMTIGRHASCQVCFPKDLAIVSRKHARIVREGNRFMLLDQSTNGTFVNGKLVKETVLKDGDVLMFAEGGPKLSFLTEMVSQPVDAAPALMPPEAPVPEMPPPIAPDPPPVMPVADPPPPDLSQTPSAEKSVPPGPEVPVVPSPPPTAPQQPPVPVASVSAGSAPAKSSADISIQPVNKPLVIQYGPTLQSFNVLPVTIGNGSTCDFMLDHPAIFERHAQVFFHQGRYWVKDLTGKGMILINGSPINTEGVMEPENRLSLSAQGPEFRFLGSGRLAEIEPAPSREPASSPPAAAAGNSTGKRPTKGVKEIGAMMKKMLKKK